MSQAVTRIRASRSLLDLGVAELWRHRELLYFLTWRDLKVRYKQTVFGAAWAILQPVLLMLVFTISIGRFVRPPSGVPYPVFAYAGLVPWTLFASGLVAASNSLAESPNLISKIYFPRLTMPVAAAASYVVDFLIALVLLVGLMFAYGVTPHARALVAPLLAVAILAAALSVGIWTAAINVKYRDVRYVIPFAVQVWLFATPVAYPTSVLPARWHTVYALNPMAGIVDGFRWLLLDTPAPSRTLPVSLLATVVLLAAGMVYFRRAEQSFADWV